MNIKLKKVVAFTTALSVLSIATASNVFAVDTTTDEEEELVYTEFPFVRECEDAEIANGNETWTNIYGTEIPDYSGDGFVYLTGNSMKFEITVPEDGMYEVSVRYAQILSQDEPRQQTISINGTDHMVGFPYSDTWQDISMGMFRLKAGVNTIEIKPQYGYACYDTITVDKANYPDLTSVQPVLSDKNATSETQSLMNFLTDVYGTGVLSGQQEIYGGGHDGNYEYEFDYLKNLTGYTPAIRGFDFMNYNPLYGWDDNTTERVIEWVTERNGIATASWHINVPVDFANYELGDEVSWTDCTYGINSDFDTANAIVEGTKEYEYFMLAVDDLAQQLLRLQDANVPIILRPLHEAEGNGGLDGSGAWFWWSKAGADVYKQLWKLLYTTLTEDYGLHNIIWEQNLYDWSTDSYEWYVGDDYVDIVGYDKYNTQYHRYDGLSSGPNEDAISSTFYNLVKATNNTKMVAMAENDTIPSLSNMEIEKAYWLYFCPWYDTDSSPFVSGEQYQNADTLKELYQSDYCINLEELPENLYTSYTSNKVTDTTPSTTEAPTVTTTTDASETTDAVVDTTQADTTETTTTTDDTPSLGDSDGSSSNLLGDANVDGTVKANDLLLVKKHILGISTLSGQGYTNCDINGDGTVKANDLLVIKKYILGIITEL